jgi:hypothetical protein
MAKTTGLSDYFSLTDSGSTERDLSGNIQTVTLNSGQALQDTTDLSQSAFSRLALLSDLSINLTGVCDFAANKQNAVMSSGTTTERTFIYAVGGNTSGYPKLTGGCLVQDYAITRGNDASLTWSCTLQLSDGSLPAWGTV